MLAPILPSRYHDSLTGTPSSVAPNVFPPPDDFTIGDSLRRTRVTVSPGTLSIGVEGAPWAGLINQHVAGLYIDNVWSQTLTWSGTIGTKETKTVALDGAAHIIDIEEQQVSITNVSSATLVTDSRPANRIILCGTSIGEGLQATDVHLMYPALFRRTLPVGYGLTNFSITGKLFFTLQQQLAQIISRADGTSKNLFLIDCMVNDVLLGVTQTQFQTAANNIVAGLLASGVPAPKVLLVSMTQMTLAPGAGVTQVQANAIFAAKAAADPTNVVYLDNSNVYPGSTPWATYLADGLHPTNTGHNVLSGVIGPAALALF